MRISLLLSTLFVLILPSPWAAAQRDSSAFEGLPWEAVEQERDAIENAILSDKLPSGLVISGSAMYLRNNSPAFQDITTSVFRAYAGLPPEKAEDILAFLVEQASSQPSGLGWIEAGLCARSLMKADPAVVAFREALKDQECCNIPMTYAYLGQSLLETGDIQGATESFVAGIRAASGQPSVLFQVRHLYIESLLGRGLTASREKILAEAAASNYPLERSWALHQLAQEAWRQGDMETFSHRVGEAVLAKSVYGATPQWLWRWDQDRWNQLQRHLGLAMAALEGASDGKLALDFETAIAEVYEGSLEAALARLEPWLDDYPLEEVPKWDATRRLWGQRLHLFHNNLLGRLGRTDEAVAGFYNMLAHATDTYHVKFEPEIWCQLGYCLFAANRLEEAREAYETGLSLVDVPGDVLDPKVAYYRKGRIGKQARMNAVANYRGLINRLSEEGGHQ